MYMYYTIYRTTNLINSKVYIGFHKTDDLEDDKYLGSGKYLNRAIKKYGDENFKKEILFVFDNPEDMKAKEKELVNEEFKNRKDTYNLKVGGDGGFGYINTNGLNNSANNNTKGGRATASKLKTDEEFRKTHGRRSSVSRKRAHRAGKIPYDNFKGKVHSICSKAKMSASSKGKQIGADNSQYGTCWVYNISLQQSKKIQINDLAQYLVGGWTKGRKMNFI